VVLTAGELVTIEVFGNRLDQTTWTAALNAAGVKVIDVDGATELLEQSDESFQWNPDQDTDVAAFRAPATGTYFLRVDVANAAATGGDYLLAVRDVGFAAPLQFEAEAEGVSGDNDTEATAEPITPGTVSGFHVDDESDFYSFTVTNPALVTFALFGHRDGAWKTDTYFDPEIVLEDPSFVVLDDNDDTFYLDSSIHRVLETPGTYFLEVTECCADGDAGYSFEFTLDEVSTLGPVAEVEPNDDQSTAQAVQFGDFAQGTIDTGEDDFYSIACNAGDRVYVQVFDIDNYELAADDVDVVIEDATPSVVPMKPAGGGLQFQRTILTSTGTFFVHVTPLNGLTDYALRVTQIPAAFESEPNDAVAAAGSFDAGRRAAGVIGTSGDVDLFAFQATAGVPVFFQCLADEVGPGGFDQTDDFGSDLDPVLTVLDAASSALSTADSSSGTTVGVNDGLSSVSLMFLPATTGTCFLKVEDRLGDFGPSLQYVLEQR
jgi:hypothetical protein